MRLIAARSWLMTGGIPGKRKLPYPKRARSRRLRLEPLEDRRLLAPVADIVCVPPDPRSTAVGNVTINFSEPVTGVDLSDFKLTRNGATVPLGAAILSGSGASYTLDLSSVTDVSGAYVLTLVAAGSGISDSVGN